MKVFPELLIEDLRAEIEPERLGRRAGERGMPPLEAAEDPGQTEIEEVVVSGAAKPLIENGYCIAPGPAKQARELDGEVLVEFESHCDNLIRRGPPPAPSPVPRRSAWPPLLNPG